MEIKNKGSSTAPSRRETRNVPATWRRSELTQFIALAEEQTLATVAGLPEWVAALEQIDNMLTVKSETFFHEIDVPRREAAWLYMRAFATFRAACRLALSGQIFEATVLIRSIIESAVYGFACGESARHRELWRQRDVEDAETYRKAKDAFKWISLVEILKAKDPRLEHDMRRFYSESIEFGAHPNVDGVMLSTEVTARESKSLLSTIHLHGPDAIVLVVIDLLRAMHLVYRLLDHTIGNRLKLMGIDEELQQGAKATLNALEKLGKQLQGHKQAP